MRLVAPFPGFWYGRSGLTVCPILWMRRHFLPRGQYMPECHKGLGQDVSSADEIGIALVIAGDT